jgi:hypothetical protein
MEQDKSSIFTVDDKITSVEVELIRAVEAGRDFASSADDLNGDQIRGGLIRAMMIGAALKHHPDADAKSGPRAVRVTAHGIRIVPAPLQKGNDKRTKRAKPAAADGPLLRIAGELNLAGLAAPGGGYLPPLQFNRCAFERPITLSGTHLESLTLIESRFSALHAEQARINGKVTLQACRPRHDPTDPGERYFATHDLAAHKDGSRGYSLRTPPRQTTVNQECGCPLCASPGEGEAGNCSLCCVVNLNSAAIDGSLEIKDSYLRAPELIARTYSTPRIWDNSAACFDGLQVRDRVIIGRTTFIGRLSFVSAEIGDDVWISGGKIFASAESRSIDFQLATIGGILAFQAKMPTPAEEKEGIRAFPVVVLGQISAIGLDAGEVWIGEGFYFAHDPQKRGAFSTINFSKADTRGSFKIGAYYDYHVPDPGRLTAGAKIHGEICLQAATIGKNLNVHGADPDDIAEILHLDHAFFHNFGVVRNEPPYLKLSGHGLKVDRRVYISHGCFRDTAKCPAAANAAGAPLTGPKDRQPAAIDLWKSTIGIGFRIGEQCSCSGALRLNSCVIGREVIIGCRLIEAGPVESAPEGEAKDAIPYLVDISESTIKGHLKIGRHVPRAPAVAGIPDGAQTAVTIMGGLNLESANIQGSILLGHVSFDLQAFALPDVSPGHCLGTGRGSAMEEKRIALNLRDCACGSDLDVHSLRWQLPRLAPHEICAANDPPRGIDRLRGPRQARRFQSIAGSSFALIDLRGLHCGLLVDGFGAEWGLVYRLRLRLAGIKIGEVEPASHKAPHASTARSASTELRPDLARLRWLAHQNCRQRVVNETATAGDPCAPVPVSLLERYFCAREDDFVPQAYDVFSTAYRRAGENRTAEHILVERKNIENALRFQRLWGKWRAGFWTWKSYRLPLLAAVTAIMWTLAWRVGLVPGHSKSLMIATAAVAGTILAWPILVALFQMIFRWGFRYGLSVQSALMVFAGFILIGWGAVYWARNGGWQPVDDWSKQAPRRILRSEIALVLDVPYEPGDDPYEPGDKSVNASRAAPRDAGTRAFRPAAYARPSPCNLDVNSLLYAIDLFIPLMDLDQERRCTVRDAAAAGSDDYAGWRFAKAIYELLGWLVTSLVILTITGVLRRDLES